MAWSISVGDTRISSSEFGQYHYVRFLQWAFGDRKSKASLLRDLAVARTDANKDLIQDKMAEYAEFYGMTVDQLTDRIVEADQRKVSIAKLHDQLEAEREEQ